MLRKSTLGSLSLLMLAGSLSFHGCGSEEEGPTAGHHEESVGKIGLDLRLPDGSDVNEVSYSITRTGFTARTGVIPVAADGHARLQVGSLPAASGYTIALNASRGDAAAPCQGSATFSITAGQTTNVSVPLQCGTLGRSGNVAIDGTFNYCPSTPTIIATPSSVPVGQPVTLSAEALDEDPVSYVWSAPSGSFAAPAQANTTFTCSVPGSVRLTVSASDNQGCNGVTSTVDVTCTEAVTFSSQPAYLVAVAQGVTIRAILTVGDSPSRKPNGSPYRLVGLPDGLGALDNNDGTFTLLATHEIASGGAARAHGGTGAFVSRWTVRKSDLGVLTGSDLIQTVNLWSTATSSYVVTPNVNFSRFCSADLPGRTALYNAATGLGFDGELFFGGEESGSEGRVVAHGMDGVTYELPRLGKASWENVVVSPFAQNKTVSIGIDDSTPGQVYVYVGTKTNSGSLIDRAGLTNGTLYGVAVTGFATEPAAGIPTGPFTLASLGDTSNTTGAALETASTAAGVTRFNRPEDGAWDPARPNDFYFVTTNAIAAPSRLWRLRFNDIAQPELGGTLEMLLDGTEGQIMLDNIGMDSRGHILLQEDPGNNARLAQVWRYTVATDTLTNIAQHNPALFTTGSAGFITQDEESSGAIDATNLLGAGWWLVTDQAHTSAGDTELVERGQLSAIFDPGTL